ncbi:MAG: diacylglycerol kinase family lipid kinase [Bacteroidetes bacterium]|jgi:diacylglycerol kinase (ATP)|nr:diacylglycerol kinase family lipid kinase [Bacteroidota bacterium]MBT6685995.1 diacylglycerol kinase family lipid kinase [Bacteroidota bacterium]MBT7143777.1 diacylglycerol kinase family lipid kinase [Bacteroidota bacterium]MBT7490876.1 diacylglycerol kinase family lipid kinase [Bacteroidota bacterium]
MKKVLFIINPISGIGKHGKIANLIPKILDNKNFSYEIKYTENEGHATEIAKEASANFDIITAVGGDGLVNEISNSLINTNIKFAIIPAGSGNGFARHLKIPCTAAKAIQLINKQNIRKIDTAHINDKTFVNVAGIGFDAHIAHNFSKSKKRGFLSYIKIIFQEFYKYKAQQFTLVIDGEKINEKAFSISFCNSSQFGNNAFIAPQAKIDDGFLNVAIIKKFPAIAAPLLAVRLFNKTIQKSKYYKSITAKEIRIIQESQVVSHIDGEAIHLPQEIKIKINPLSLNVIC